MRRITSFFSELQRRKVFRVGSIYVVTAWALTLGAADLFPAFDAPAWTVRLFAAVAVLGLPIALALAWAFEVTPVGVERDLGRNNVPASAATTALFGAHGVVRARWVDPKGGAREMVFDRTFEFGRDAQCAVCFDDPLVSRRHAQVSVHAGAWHITDLGSRNGTFVDGLRVERAPLPPRGVIRLSEGGPEIGIEVQGKAGSLAATELSKSGQA
jgi:hypothetical protein